MGITGLSKLIADIAPFAVKDGELKNYFGKKLIFEILNKIINLFCYL